MRLATHGTQRAKTNYFEGSSVNWDAGRTPAGSGIRAHCAGISECAYSRLSGMENARQVVHLFFVVPIAVILTFSCFKASWISANLLLNSRTAGM